MRSYFTAINDKEEIAQLKKLARVFDITPYVDNLTINGRVQVTLEGDVTKINEFEKQYLQYLSYRQKLKNTKK